MRTFSMRLDESDFEVLEKKRGDRQRTDYAREILLAHLREPPEPQGNRPRTAEEPPANLIESLRVELAHKDAIIQLKDDRIKDLQNSGGWLISEFTKLSRLNEKLLLPAVPIKRKWWEVWNK